MKKLDQHILKIHHRKRKPQYNLYVRDGKVYYDEIKPNGEIITYGPLQKAQGGAK